MATLREAFATGYATQVNSQDSANDNPYWEGAPRLAFEVGAYFMRAGRSMPKRVERGPIRGEARTLYVDGILYAASETSGGLRVDVVS